MKATEFKSWIEAFNRMSRDQRNILRERLHYKNKWLNYKQALLQGLNLRKAAKRGLQHGGSERCAHFC